MEFHRVVPQTAINQLLNSVEKPARYIGGELNCVVKEEKLRARAALLFPDVYEVAESHIGLKILYNIIYSLTRSESDVVPSHCQPCWSCIKHVMSHTSEVDC